MKKFFLMLFFCLSGTALSFSETTKEMPLFENNFRVVNYFSEQGLSQSVVTSIAQDDQGYLWIATGSGLNRFDGLNFTVFNHDPDDKNSLPYQTLTSLYYDGHHKLWIASNNGLSYFDTVKGRFHTPENLFPPGKQFGPFQIAKARGDFIWLRPTNELFLFNTVTMIKKKIDLPFSLKNGAIFFGTDEAGNIWLLKDDGLITFNIDDVQGNTLKRYEMISRDLSNCLDLSFVDKVVWISCDDDMLKYYPEKKQFIREGVLKIKQNVSFQKLYSGNGKYWIPSSHGLWVRDKSAKNWKNFIANPLLKNTLQINTLNNIFVDRNSLVWIGTFGAGLSMWDPKSQYIHYYLNPFQLSEYSRNTLFWKADVTDIAFDAKENLWVSTRSAGVYQLNSAGKILQHIDTSKVKGLQSNDVTSVYVDKSDRLWLSTLYEGVFIKDRNKGWQHLQIRNISGSNFTVVRVFEDSRGRVFLSTFKGLFLYEESTNKLISLMDAFPDKFKKLSLRISKVLEASDGYYWIATDAGVVVLDHDLNYFAWFNSHEAPLPLSHNEANDIVEDKFGNIWVATASGVDRISYIEHKWVVQNYNNIDLLKGQSFFIVVADKKGLIWLGGVNGLYQLDPTSEEVNIIPQKYGLQGVEFNSNAGAIDSKGWLYFGGVNGLNVIEPEKLTINYPASSIVNSKFIVDGKKVEKTDSAIPITFDDNSKYIQLKFDVVDLANAENIELRMRIPEISDRWSPWTVERFFNLFDLTPGLYHVELQSRVAGKSNILNSAQISFQVNSSTTLADYFFWIVSIAVAALVMFFIRWQYQKWIEQKLSLINEQIRLTDEIAYFRKRNNEHKSENSQLLDELSSVFKDKDLLERQLHDLHLVDKQTGLHTRDFIKYSIDNAIRQLTTMLPESSDNGQLPQKHIPQYIPQLQFLIIKLDGFEKLRLQGGQFLLNQIIIQIAAEMKNISGAADELVRWNQDSFLLYARADKDQTLQALCEKLCTILRQGEFGPSSSEQIAMTCSIAALRFPFVETETLEVDWPKLIELTESAANWWSETYGDGWLIISARQKHNNRVFVEQGISNFGEIFEKELFDIKTSSNEPDNNS